MQDVLPSDPGLAIDTARKLVATGDIDSAIKGLETYVAAHPRDIEPARYLGDLYYRKSDLASAERIYLKILRISPDDHETHNRLGGIYAAEDRVQDAIDQFQRSLPSAGAFFSLVELHRRKGDLAAYESETRREADQRPTDAEAQYQFGSVLRAEHKSAEAVVYLQRSLDDQPNSCWALSELGSAYLDIDHVPQAIATMQQCLLYNPNDYPSLVNLGDAFIAEADFGRARDYFQRANKVRPDRPEAIVDIGYLEDVAQHWQAAVQYYLRAIGVDPLSRDAYVNLGYDYDEHGLYPLAEAAFLKGLSFSPNDGRLHYMLGVTYAEQGKSALARSEYSRATSSDEPEVARAAERDLGQLRN